MPKAKKSTKREKIQKQIFISNMKLLKTFIQLFILFWILRRNVQLIQDFLQKDTHYLKNNYFISFQIPSSVYCSFSGYYVIRQARSFPKAQALEHHKRASQ